MLFCKTLCSQLIVFQFLACIMESGQMSFVEVQEMKRRNYLAALLFALALLSSCAANTPAEPAADEAPAAEAQTEPVAAEKVPEIPVFEPREPYRLNEVEAQLLQNGDEITVDGICRFTVKGFGCGRMVTADGNTCAGAKKGEVLVWLTCEYVNLSGAKVSSKKLIKQAHIRYDGGYSVGKSASFSKIVPDETVEVYFYYPIPEALDTQTVTMEFTIGEQAYRYEVPADRAGAIEPTFPKQDEPEEAEKQPITVEAPPSERQKPENNTSDSQKSETAVAANQRRVEASDGKYWIQDLDDANRLIKATYYAADGSVVIYYTREYTGNGQDYILRSYDANGNLYAFEDHKFTSTQEILTRYSADGTWLSTSYYENINQGHLIVKLELADGHYETFSWSDTGHTEFCYRADGTLERTGYYDSSDKLIKIEYPDGTVITP